MAGRQQPRGIPNQLSIEQFDQFFLPHLIVGTRGPTPKLFFYNSFSYILKLLYTGCQWKELPIDKDNVGLPEIHYIRIYSVFRRWESAGCMRAIFAGSVFKLHHHGLLDTSIIHGDKIVAFCDRNCNVIAPFVTAPGNKNESPLFREALPGVMRIARAIGIDLQGTHLIFY